ncbi:hypothetical protein ABEB36_000489 [Hypothenemus hampei]|uniref:Phage protein n=1 Tax=Hypothenemus hampei TaxID=57062 RepID=A0ABD1FE11_HYPHA
MLKRVYTITLLGTTYTITIEDAIKTGLSFKRYDMTDPENWYGIAAPYIDFFVANMLRLSELRTGDNLMPITRDGDRIRCFPVEKYELNGGHHILLEGCTFPPEKRGSMAQSVDPMTAMLHIRTEEKYRR